MKSFGGETVGVVDRGSTYFFNIRSLLTMKVFYSSFEDAFCEILPFETGVSNFCLKSESIAAGNVVPRSQMSISLRILACYTECT